MQQKESTREETLTQATETIEVERRKLLAIRRSIEKCEADFSLFIPAYGDRPPS